MRLGEQVEESKTKEEGKNSSKRKGRAAGPLQRRPGRRKKGLARSQRTCWPTREPCSRKEKRALAVKVAMMDVGTWPRWTGCWLLSDTRLPGMEAGRAGQARGSTIGDAWSTVGREKGKEKARREILVEES